MNYARRPNRPDAMFYRQSRKSGQGRRARRRLLWRAGGAIVVIIAAVVWMMW